MGIAITAGSVAFAASLKTLNAELAESYKKEEQAKKDAQENERAAILAKNDAIAARNAEADALKKERQAREKAEALVQGAFAQNRNALERNASSASCSIRGSSRSRGRKLFARS